MALLAARPPGSPSSGQCSPCRRMAIPPTSIVSPSRTRARPVTAVEMPPPVLAVDDGEDETRTWLSEPCRSPPESAAKAPIARTSTRPSRLPNQAAGHPRRDRTLGLRPGGDLRARPGREATTLRAGRPGLHLKAVLTRRQYSTRSNRHAGGWPLRKYCDRRSACRSTAQNAQTDTRLRHDAGVNHARPDPRLESARRSCHCSGHDGRVRKVSDSRTGCSLVCPSRSLQPETKRAI
jgi:hypothetical protein